MIRAGLPIALFAVAGATVWTALAPGETAAPAAPAPVETAPAAETTTLDLPEPAAADMGPFLDRPLFSAARRPPPPETAMVPIETVVNPLLFGRYEITGVVVLGDRAVAMLRDAETGVLVRVSPGDTLGAAEIVDVTLERLTFRAGGVTFDEPVEGRGRGN